MSDRQLSLSFGVSLTLRSVRTVCVSSRRTFIAFGVDTILVMYVSTAFTTSMVSVHALAVLDVLCVLSPVADVVMRVPRQRLRRSQ